MKARIFATLLLAVAFVFGTAESANADPRWGRDRGHYKHWHHRHHHQGYYGRPQHYRREVVYVPVRRPHPVYRGWRHHNGTYRNRYVARPRRYDAYGHRHAPRATWAPGGPYYRRR